MENEICMMCGDPADIFYNGNTRDNDYQPENAMWLCNSCYEEAMLAEMLNDDEEDDDQN